MPSSLNYDDRVKDTGTTTGTGNFTLSGSIPATYRSFNAAFGNGTASTANRFIYAIVHQTLDEWEIGIGYLSAATTLVREQVLNSTNSDALVNFSAGTKDVFNTYPAWKASKILPRGRIVALLNGNFMT